MKTYSLVDPKAEGHLFVNGNTKHLKHMDQNDLKVLFENGDERVTEDLPKNQKAPKLSLAEPSPVATI